MLYDFTMKSVNKECHHFKTPPPNCLYIKFTSNTPMNMMRMPLGTLEIKFPESKIFIRRNRLNRLMSHKLKTKQTTLFAFDIYKQRFLIKRGIDEFLFLPHICLPTNVPDRF